ncbi:asparagine synthase (glutamine-hydrolysing) [Lachnospiraceae bacterium]|nr:asparagine synthase (glutamine-hydrolysing) [Lachnospiraceae bacterium]
MSIIWGAVSLDGRPIAKEQQDILKAPALKCPIDKFSEIYDNGIYMGCVTQYFTVESHKEKSPLRDKESGIWFDADVVLDNRDEIGRALGMASETWSDMADGDLLYRFFRKFEDRRLNDPLGAYSFAYFDEKRRKLFLVGDATGYRFLYYRVIGKTLFFSTFIESLRPLASNTINERWVSYYLGESTLGLFRDINETITCEVKRISLGSYLIFDDEGVHEKQYWMPMMDGRELRLKSDDEYREAFQELMHDAVTRVLRSESETGICLSGGFDSNTVNAFAAPFLEKQGKKLHTFTMIPEKGLLTEKDGRGGATDESGFVRKTAEIFKNLDCSFLDMSDINIWNMNKEMVDYAGQPIKSVYNMAWFQNTYKKAREKGIKLILTGEYGNLSVSFGDYALYTNELFRSHRYIKLLSESRAYCKNNGYSFKYFLKSFLKDKAGLIKHEYRGIDETFLMKDAPGRAETERYLREVFEENRRTGENFAEMKKKLDKMIILRQISDFSSTLTSKEGILERDPTRDKKVIEWCMSLPVEQFTKEGRDRRLIREYMKGIVPDHILNVTNKGVQASDKKQRLSREWDAVRHDGLALIDRVGSNKWIDVDKLRKAIVDDPKNYSGWKLANIMGIILLLDVMDRATS